MPSNILKILAVRHSKTVIPNSHLFPSYIQRSWVRESPFRFHKIQENSSLDFPKIVKSPIRFQLFTMSNHSRCAACRFLRRRCPEDCIFSPYFPSTDPQRFACVHKIYGASNVSKMLQQIPVHLRAHASDSIFFEAHARIQDPIYGCVGIISRLQHEIYANQRELANTQAAIAFNNAQQAQAQAQETQIQQLQHVDEASGFIGPFHMDQPSLDHHYHVPGFL